MKRCELLSPAGNMEMLKHAIAYGADAIYLAGTRFGARKFAANFTEEEMIEAVKYAHLYGVKVYVTINTLVYDEEVNDFVDYVDFIHRIGVDAVLVQDLGMLTLIRKHAPNLEVHASTQFHNDGPKVAKFLKNLGVKRIVLDREMSLKEIEKMPADIEIEVFCHGALCVSYSGQCLFSSEVLGRSGNRGECAGLCRLPYKLKDKDHVDKEPSYHLSLKDLHTTDSVYELLDRHVSSLKIEGRMKSPEYVGYMTKIYRKLIDSYYEGKRVEITKEEMTNIQILFNRGLTRGYLHDTPDEEMVNTKSPNHIGIHLGTYRPLKDKVELTLAYPLEQGDTIRFQDDGKGMTVNFLYDKKDKLINRSEPKTKVYVDNFLGIEHSGELRLVGSTSLSKEIASLPKRKVKIDLYFEGKQGSDMTLKVKCGSYSITVHGPKPSPAQNRPITKEDVERQLSKVGSTVYEIGDLTIDLDENLFINLKDLNELRRNALAELDEVRTTTNQVVFTPIEKVKTKTQPSKPQLLVVLETEEQYEVAKRYTDHLFSTNKTLLSTHPDVYPKYVSSHEKITGNKYMLGNYGLLLDAKDKDEIYTDYMLNITNSYTIDSILQRGVKCALLSIELEPLKHELDADLSKVGILIYGKIELMKMKYDPTKKRGTHLVDRNKEEYVIKKDDYYNYLMSSKPKDRTDKLDTYKKMGFGFYRIDFIDESDKFCAKILEKIHKNIYEE